jgi:hypothetical protein
VIGEIELNQGALQFVVRPVVPPIASVRPAAAAAAPPALVLALPAEGAHPQVKYGHTWSILSSFQLTANSSAVFYDAYEVGRR